MWILCLHPVCCVLVLPLSLLLPAGFKKVGTPSLLESVGVSPDAAMTKMRLMALLMQGSKASGAPVAFTDIQAALDITPEQVRRVYFCSCARVFGSAAGLALSWQQREQELPAHLHASPCSRPPQLLWARIQAASQAW